MIGGEREVSREGQITTAKSAVVACIWPAPIISNDVDDSTFSSELESDRPRRRKQYNRPLTPEDAARSYAAAKDAYSRAKAAEQLRVVDADASPATWLIERLGK